MLAGLLAAVAMIRVHDEEIPHIALMTAAFFVASLIHAAHRPHQRSPAAQWPARRGHRSPRPLAILIGVTLQFAVFAHGGGTTIGVNTGVMALPALGAALLFGVLSRGTRWAWFRFALVVVSGVLWLECLVYSIACLLVSIILPWMTHFPPSRDIAWVGAAMIALHPITLAVVGLLSVAAAVLERRLRHPAEFPAGLLVGMAAVLATLVLQAAVLLFGGAADNPHVGLLTFIAHIPIMAVEGVVLGFAVGFLGARETRNAGRLLGADRARDPATATPRVVANGAVTAARPAGVALLLPALPLLAVLGVLWTATPAHAHRLDAGYTVRADGQVQVDKLVRHRRRAARGGQGPGGPLERRRAGRGCDGRTRNLRLPPNGSGRPQGRGDGGGGHRAEFVIPASALPQPPADGARPAEAPSPRPTSERSTPSD